MAKAAVEVKQDVLTKVIADLEAKKTFPNLNALWKEAADTYNAQPGVPAPITFSVVYQRVRTWNIPIKTQPGKKRSTSSDGGDASGSAPDGSDPDAKLTVQISDKVRVVRQDRYNVTIERNIDGTWKQQGFYGSLETALIRLVDSIIPGESMTAKELLSAWEGIKKRIIDAVEAMKETPASVTTTEDVAEEESDDAEA